MTTRHRVTERAEAIYTFLKTNLNTLYTINELMEATGLHDSSTTRAAIKKSRDFAAEDGLCFPVACWDNGNTYCVTDVAAAAMDPAIHLGKIANGVGVRKDVHDDFMRARLGQLTPTERAMFHSLEEFEAAQRQQRKAYSSVLKVLTAARREAKEQRP